LIGGGAIFQQFENILKDAFGQIIPAIPDKFEQLFPFLFARIIFSN
jgi:hypothetical protein